MGTQNSDAELRVARYAIGARTVESGTPGFIEAVAWAHASQWRPKCLCQPKGIEMYVARLADGYLIKRMPDTGCQHALDCPSYGPPAEDSGLGQVLGSAIVKDPQTGETTLRLDFPLIKQPGRIPAMPSNDANGRVSSQGTKLSLCGLLHYLWDQAELTHWHPGFMGRRNWPAVRRQLLLAAEHKSVRDEALRDKLYIPEPFFIDERDAIEARRRQHWGQLTTARDRRQRLMLLIGELKEIVPARYGHKAVVKQIPDQAFVLDDGVYDRLARRFQQELTLWGLSSNVRMIMAATVGMSAAGMPTISELWLMPVTREWLPVENAFEQELVDRLVREQRSFVKGLRYNWPSASELAAAVLTDCGDAAGNLFISSESTDRLRSTGRSPPEWRWNTSEGAMPQLPTRQWRAPA